MIDSRACLGQKSTHGAKQFGTCQRCVDAQFQMTLGRIQCQLHHLAGHDAEAVARAANHSQGPKAKWVNVGIEMASDRCRSTVPSRAWSISACWLRTILTAKRRTEAQAAKWRMLYHPIDTKTMDEDLRADVDHFLAWRSCITKEALDHRQWAKTFYAAAIRMQKLCEGRAAARAAIAFRKGLLEGPIGVKRQHQLSRTTEGWIPTKACRPLANDFEPIDEVDGLSQEQLDSISLAGQDEAPLTAQQNVNDERCRWGGEWAVGEQWSEPDWTEFEANEDPLPISVPELRWALNTFPVGSGLGWDGIHPRALDRLDNATCQSICDLLLACETAGKWPSATDLVVVLLLAKNRRRVEADRDLDADEAAADTAVGSFSIEAIPLRGGCERRHRCSMEAIRQGRARTPLGHGVWPGPP